MKKSVLMVALCAVLCGSASAVELPPTTVIPECIQDQYGNQYGRLVFDLTHRIITGIAHVTQCRSDWSMIGSWDVDSAGGIIMELTAANTPNSPCVDMFKLRGVYPDATWNYTSGFGGQPFSYIPCTSLSNITDPGVGGAHGRDE
jgi:hypothetical protein